MNGLFRACSAAISSNSTNVLRTSSFCKSSAYRWNASVNHVGSGSVNFNWFLNSFSIRLYSSKGSRRKNYRSQKSGPTLATTPKMNEDGDSFFVVRKGDLIGIYKNLSDCQTQVGSSICDPPVSVFKGYSMPKNTEEYLLSHGLKNALYTVRAQDVTEDLFDTLEPCHPQQLSSSSGGMPNDHMAKKRCQEARWLNYTDDDAGPAAARPTDSSIRKHVMLEKTYDTALSSGQSCSLEFDGASKGNPGQAGAGAVLRADDGSLTIKLREGLGVATNNVAEYRAIILGLRCALSKGFTRIRAQGDSKLVCMQIQGLWKVKNENISTLYEQAKQLKDRFHSFQLVHVLRDSNAEADEQANLAIHLADGQVQEEVA